MKLPPRESRPAGNQAADDSQTTNLALTLLQPGTDRTLAVARRRWAYALISKCRTPPPRYGSPEWLALPEGTPAKIAGVVIAAEAWASDTDNMPENLARELHDLQRLAKEHDDADYEARARGHRSRWRHLRVVPDRGDIDARVREARRPRTGDFPGRNGAGEPDAS